MQEIDVLIDEDPKLSLELIDNEIRNKQSHDELQSYNDSKTFVYKHKLTLQQRNSSTVLAELYDLKKNNPDAFINECYSIKRNIQRYSKQLSNDKFKDAEDKQRTVDSLERYNMKNDIVQSLLND